MTEDPTLQTRLDVAEMKGMLQAVVGAHSERLAAHDVRLDTHDMRINDQAKSVARHDERVKDLEDDNTARSGKFYGTLGLVIGALGLVVSGVVGLIAVVNFFAS